MLHTYSVNIDNNIAGRDEKSGFGYTIVFNEEES